MIGKTLAHYEISSQLGKGGMGEVYQAKDKKLGRDVAIKVLPEEFAKDADRVARFQREAKLLASLNHPNIAAIYGLEESNGTHFLVLELIEGDTLADRLKRGAIPVEESLKLALQIAEALEAAHEKGVIHRDLKPANIKVTADGKVKVLDFGLAKAFSSSQEDISLSNSPTLSVAATQQGIILGTAAYMSPEQARGKPVDKRTDIWAFGVVLFEMLTGQSAFQGEDVSVTLASVIKGDANLNLLPPSIHPRAREVITRCLQYEIRSRYSSVADAQYEIEQALSDPGGLFVQPVTAAKPRKTLRLGIPWFVAAIIMASIIVGVTVWYLKPSEPRQVVRLDFELPEGQQFVNMGPMVVTISPDGSLLAYSMPEGLCLRSMDDWTVRLLAGTEGAVHPFFSPDGQWIGYASPTDGKLKKISISGGASVTLCNASPDGGFSWTSDNRILQASGDSIRWVSADGGEMESLFKEIGNTLGAPQMLPDGESVLFATGAAPPHKIMIRSLKSAESKELFEGAFARYIKTGHIVYGVGNDLFAVPFDPDTLDMTGGPRSLVEGVLSGQWVWHYAISESGTLVYIPGETAGANKKILVWVDRDGNVEPIAAEPDDYRALKISPDGTQIAVSIFAGGSRDIHIWDIARENMRRLSFDESNNGYPLWTPNGKSIVFASGQTSEMRLCRKKADGTGEVETIRSENSLILPSSWSVDGKTLVVVVGSPPDVGMLYMEGDEGIKPLLPERYSERYPRISPDGKWLAYASRESGQEEVHVCPFPEVNSGRWKVSANGGTSPLWSRDGQELFYWTDDALMVVPVETEQTFTYGTPKVQFKGTPVVSPIFGIAEISWDIHPEGKKFLMIKPPASLDTTEAMSRPRINIILNWFEELKERVPVD